MPLRATSMLLVLVCLGVYHIVCNVVEEYKKSLSHRELLMGDVDIRRTLKRGWRELKIKGTDLSGNEVDSDDTA